MVETASHGWDFSSRLYHRRPAERMTYEQPGRLIGVFEKVGRRNEVRHVGGEIRFGKIPFAFTKAGKIEPQDRDPMHGKRPVDVHDRS